MGSLNQLATSPSLEKEGTWLNYANDISCRISRINNPEFKEYMEGIIRELSITKKGFRKPSKGEDPLEKITNEELLEHSKEGVAKFILRDWFGVDKDGAEPVESAVMESTDHNNWRKLPNGKFIETQPYTPTLGMELFADDRFTDFFMWVVMQSKDVENYRQQYEVESAKN